MAQLQMGRNTRPHEAGSPTAQEAQELGMVIRLTGQRRGRWKLKDPETDLGGHPVVASPLGTEEQQRSPWRGAGRCPHPGCWALVSAPACFSPVCQAEINKFQEGLYSREGGW